LVQNSADVPNACANSMAVSGVICFLPCTIWLMTCGGRPTMLARSCCVQPRSSSSRRRMRPGATGRAGLSSPSAITHSPLSAMVVIDLDDLDVDALPVTLLSDDQAPALVESQGSVSPAIALELLVVKRLEGSEILRVLGGLHRSDYLEEGFKDRWVNSMRPLLVRVERLELLVQEDDPHA